MKTKSIDIIPVIHVQTLAQALLNVEIVLSCGLSKVMFISMDGNSDLTLNVSQTVKTIFPKLWVGVNLLESFGQTKVLLENESPLIDAIWSDRAVKSGQIMRKYAGKFFGGLAFKYQPQPESLEEACMDAVKCMDVITTSGPATGKQAEIAKLKAIREFIGDHPLAVASGVSKENISHYVGLVDHVLVASSITEISIGRELIVPYKLKELCLQAVCN